MESTSFSNPAATELNVEAPHPHAQRGSVTADGRSIKDAHNRSLHQLAKDGEVNQMQEILKNLESPEVQLAQCDADRLTPLHYAARYNHFEMCQLLIKHRADVGARDGDKMTPMHHVARYKGRALTKDSDDGDNRKILDCLVKEGAKVNVRDVNKLTPLHHACQRGNEVFARAVLDLRGILVGANNREHMTPLHFAVFYGHFAIAKLLLQHKAEIRCRDVEKKTPLHLAAHAGNLNIVELLMEKVPENPFTVSVHSMLSDKDHHGNTALHLAVKSGHIGILRFLVNKAKELGAKEAKLLLDMRKFNNDTPLHIGASNGHLEIIKLLIKEGAGINIQNNDGSTPLLLAAKSNHFQIVEYLLERDANINDKDKENYTALLIAANYGHPETIKVLNNHYADIMAVDRQERNVLHQCAVGGRVEAMQELLRGNDMIKELINAPDNHRNTPLHVAASSGHFDIVKVLLEAHADLLMRNDEERTPFHLAAIHGKFEVIREFLSCDKSIIHLIDEGFNTTLHLAALNGHDECVKELVNAGASIDARNVKQWTPLDCCASKGHLKCAVVLLEANSPVNSANKPGITPLHLSCKEGHVDMVKLLIKWHADVSIRDRDGQDGRDGRNALDFAIDYGKEDCALAVIESLHWKKALANFTKNNFQTPMRKLIKKMPEVAEVVFNNCSQKGEGLPEHEDFMIDFNFEFLDDEYTCDHWKDQMHKTSRRVSQDTSVHHNSTAESYSHDSNTLMNNHCLMIMVKSKRETLLRHPLVLSLLDYKWKSYSRTVYYVNLILYSLFMAVFNSYMLTMPAPFAINSTATLADGSCVKVVDAAQDVWGSTCTLKHSFWRPFAQWIVVGLAALSILKEIFQLIGQKWKYFLSITNLLELTLYVLCVLTVLDFTDYSQNTGIREAWQWQCGAFAVFCSWMGFLLFIQKFPRFGIFVLMFTDVFKTFVSFFGVFLFFIFGFAFSFHTLFQNQFAFTYWWSSIIKTIVMMIGEFEYDALFISEFTSTAYSDQVNYGVISYIMFVLFLLIMSIIIMNLLVGLAVDDIKEVQDHAEIERIAMQVKLTLDVEYTLPHFFRRRFMKNSLSVQPNKYKSKNQVLKYFLRNKKLSAENINRALSPVKGDLGKLEDRIKAVETMLKAIVDHLKIKYTDDQNSQP